MQRNVREQATSSGRAYPSFGPERLLQLQRLQVDALNAFAQTAISTFESFWDLNLATGRMAIDRGTEHAYRLIDRSESPLPSSPDPAVAQAPAKPRQSARSASRATGTMSKSRGSPKRR